MNAVGWLVPPSGRLYPSGISNWSGSTWTTLAVTMIAVSMISWIVYRKKRPDCPGSDRRCSLLTELFLQALLLSGCVFVSYLCDSQRGGFTVKGPDYPTIALLGTDVVLNCSVVFHREESKLQVEWSKLESRAKVLVCKDIPEGPCRGYWAGVQHFEGELGSGNVSIKLQEVKVSDAGKYQCAVASSSYSSHVSLELNIVAIGTKPSLSIRQSSDNSLEYTCQSKGWFPEPDVIWKDSDGKNLVPLSTVAKVRDVQQLYDVEVRYQPTGDVTSSVTCIIRDSLHNVKEVSTARVNDFLPHVQFRVSEAEWSRIQSYLVSVTLDPDTANPWLVLSDGGTSVRDGDTRQMGVYDNPERFQVSHCVLASGGFSSGQHYWEVEVGRKEVWELGLATESVNRKAKVSGLPNTGHWSLSRQGRTEYRAVDWPPPPQPLEPGPELTMVGVLLLYSQGRVSFFDAERHLHLYTFTANLSEKVYPFFCPGPYNWQTNAEPLRLHNPKA